LLTTIQNSFSSGELSPSVFGRTDLQKYHSGASTYRNFFANYRGGAASRAGTAYCGMCKQNAPNVGGTVSSYPPRLIPFQFNIDQGYALEFGDEYMRILSDGAYVLESAVTVTSVSSAGLFTATAHGYSVGDWLYDSGNTGFSGLIWVVTAETTNTFNVQDLFGNNVTSATASTGGTVARIYTVVAPYAAEDLSYLKYTQSANTMSLTCVSYVDESSPYDYPPYDLQRDGATDWVFTEVTFASSISAPTGASATANSSTTATTYYQYVVTAVASDGEESIASNVAQCYNNDISIYAGSNTITWSAVTGATSYNIYEATPSYGTAQPSGVLFGFAGTSLSTSFVDTNIQPDFTTVPPQHQNPFTGTGYYPGCVAYFQQRRVYASTIDNPDTYYMSQPGAFLNFDYAIPIADSDSITGSPWAQQVNGIQFLVPMPGGLVVLTGSGAWQLNGGNSAAITPSDQDAQPQAYNGCNSTVPPIVVNYDILYVQAKGSIVRDLSYNFFVNIYTGTDTTVLSNQLFTGYEIIQWAYAEEPYKLIWCVRNDGTMLSFTYLKEQDVYAWARHDTNGLYASVCTVVEPPVDALYIVTQRLVNGVYVYYSERMNNRLWQDVGSCWCVDAGLTLALNYPSATIYATSANGTSNISNTLVAFGGEGYTSPTAVAVDASGQGFGATFSVTVVAGVITAVTPLTEGQNYTLGQTSILISDSTGSGAVVSAVITNNVVFTASSSVFSSGMIGDVIRTGGGVATITSYTSGTSVTANITTPITKTIPNDPNNTPIPQISGNWSIGTPTTSVSGLNHLNGLEVSILADGSVVPSQTVVNGTVTLPLAASQITVGLPYTCQLQTMYLDPPGQKDTPQGKRKSIFGVTARMEASRGISIGVNQPDASIQPNNANITWTGLYPSRERNAAVIPGNSAPLYTGDEYIEAPADWETNAQIAVQTQYPLPINLNSLIVWYEMGDTSD